MKSVIKKVLVLSLLLCICFSFSSCIRLKELKSKHAIFTDDAMTEIKYRGNLYHEVKDFPDDVYTLVKYNSCNLTTRDVPVLLSGGWYRKFNDISYDENLIILLEENNKIYCKDDFKGELDKIIKENKFDYPYVVYEDIYNERDILLSVSPQIIDTIEEVMAGPLLLYTPDLDSYINISYFEDSRRFYKDYVTIGAVYDDDYEKIISLYVYLVTDDSEYYFKIPKEKMPLFDYLIEQIDEIEYNENYLINSNWIVYE